VVLQRQTGNALVVGEWGGTYVGADAAWQDEFSLYLRRNCIADNFYWTLNPNSGTVLK
jgi:aryl-phospho-beta-D-glucosidase BglC (GH1 family)